MAELGKLEVGKLAYGAWRIPNAMFSQFRNGGKANGADYLVRRCRRRNSGSVVEKR